MTNDTGLDNDGYQPDSSSYEEKIKHKENDMNIHSNVYDVSDKDTEAQEELDEDDNPQCGWFGYRPKCIQVNMCFIYRLQQQPSLLLNTPSFPPNTPLSES